jgi:hypothetical protein
MYILLYVFYINICINYYIKIYINIFHFPIDNIYITIYNTLYRGRTKKRLPLYQSKQPQPNKKYSNERATILYHSRKGKTI